MFADQMFVRLTSPWHLLPASETLALYSLLKRLQVKP